jgi:dihydropteroate synthase
VTAPDLIIPAADSSLLAEVCSWDHFRPATFPASDFPVDVVRFAGSSSRPVVVSRSRRAETLKAFPASLRERASAAFSQSALRPARLALAHRRSLDLADAPLVMGVVNVTPDSFSDGGLYLDAGRAAARVLELFEQGAAIVDVGGESTRPGTYGPAEEIGADEELRRVLPVLEAVRRQTDRPLSIDTRRASVAERALDAGADLVNDVSGLRFDPLMAETVARGKAGAVAMHMRGTDPRTMQADTKYGHLVAEIAVELARSAGLAREAGVAADAIAVDPGLGFGKSPEGNLLLLRHLAAFRSLGLPIVVGASRKGFVRRFSGVGDAATSDERISGSLAAASAAADGGASIVRVHDVAETVRFLRMRRAIRTPDSTAVSGSPRAVSPAGAAAS